MNITINKQNEPFEKQEGWHILTVAESGFSMLNAYASDQYGIDDMKIRQFEEQVNDNNEAGSLHPVAPVSAIPRKYLRELLNSTEPSILKEFKTHLKEFIAANSKSIKSEKIVIDFRVSPSPIPQQYIAAIVEVFKLYKGKMLKDIVIIDSVNN